MSRAHMLKINKSDFSPFIVTQYQTMQVMLQKQTKSIGNNTIKKEIQKHNRRQPFGLEVQNHS